MPKVNENRYYEYVRYVGETKEEAKARLEHKRKIHNLKGRGKKPCVKKATGI